MTETIFGATKQYNNNSNVTNNKNDVRFQVLTAASMMFRVVDDGGSTHL
jgi:hypothetical protein